MATLVRNKISALLFGAALCSTTAAFAECDKDRDEESPDMAFLEYLGMWEESDEEWQLLNENIVAENEERSDPVPDSEVSTENEDES